MADDWHAPTQRAANYVVTAANWNEDQDNFDALYSAMVGDAQATAEVIHQHKTGKLPNRPAAGNVGRLYTATDLGVTFYDDGAVWHVFSHIPALCDRLTDDFHLAHGPTQTATGWLAGWRVVIGGAGGVASVPVGSHSYIEIQGDTGAGGYCNLTPKGSAQPYINPAAGVCYPLIYETCVRLNDNALVDYHFGLMDMPSAARPAAVSDAIMFRIQDGGNVVTVTNDNGGGETTNDMGAVPTQTNIDIFRIEVFSASLAHFTWWKGGLGGTKYTETHVAGIPSVNLLLPAHAVRTNAAAGKQMRIDSVDLLYKRDY